MKNTKNIFTSKTIIGILTMIAVPILAMFGFNLDAELGESLNELIANAVTMGGAMLAVYGRVVATKKIG